MAKNSIRDYDATSGNNTDVQSVDISEGCAASGINNALREIMTDLKNVSTGAVALETPAADQLNVDNIRIDGNTISSTDTNGNITLDPNGTGSVAITGSVTADGVISDSITNASSNLLIASTQSATIRFDSDNNQTNREFNLQRNTSTGVLKAEESGDITFFKDDGTTAGVFWDASSGNVGIGTASPDSPLHVIGDGKFKSSGEVKIRFQNDTTGTGSSDGSFVGLFNGSDGMALYNYEATPMRFFTSNAERMRIDSGGKLYVGTTSGISNERFILAAGTSEGIRVTHTGGGTKYPVNFTLDGSGVGSISISSGGTSYNTSSDYRLKEAVVDMTGAIDRVKALAPKRFNFIADDSVTVDGFLAHEAQAVVPEAVHGEHNEVDNDGNAVMQGIDQSKLVPLLTGALQEAIAKIETLETQRADLEARLTALENA